MSLYLDKHGQHVESVGIEGDDSCTFTVHLPGKLQLRLLDLTNVKLRLGHGRDPTGLWGTLKLLAVDGCELLDEAVGVVFLEALSGPVGLEDLTLSELDFSRKAPPHFLFPTCALNRLQV
jgi:hypothetical protein